MKCEEPNCPNDLPPYQMYNYEGRVICGPHAAKVLDELAETARRKLPEQWIDPVH